jgi:hypothetical protein
MIEIKMMKYQFGRTSEEAVETMLADRWQIKHDAIVESDGRTYYAVVWQRMTPGEDTLTILLCKQCGVEPVAADGLCGDCLALMDDEETGAYDGLLANVCHECGAETGVTLGLCDNCASGIELTEGMTLTLADGEEATISGITVKDGEVHRVKVTKPHPDNDTNVTTTMKLETLIGKLPETHPWHGTPPTYNPPAEE